MLVFKSIRAVFGDVQDISIVTDNTITSSYKAEYDTLAEITSLDIDLHNSFFIISWLVGRDLGGT